MTSNMNSGPVASTADVAGIIEGTKDWSWWERLQTDAEDYGNSSVKDEYSIAKNGSLHKLIEAIKTQGIKDSGLGYDKFRERLKQGAIAELDKSSIKKQLKKTTSTWESYNETTLNSELGKMRTLVEGIFAAELSPTPLVQYNKNVKVDSQPLSSDNLDCNAALWSLEQRLDLRNNVEKYGKALQTPRDSDEYDKGGLDKVAIGHRDTVNRALFSAAKVYRDRRILDDGIRRAIYVPYTRMMSSLGKLYGALQPHTRDNIENEAFAVLYWHAELKSNLWPPNSTDVTFYAENSERRARIYTGYDSGVFSNCELGVTGIDYMHCHQAIKRLIQPNEVNQHRILIALTAITSPSLFNMKDWAFKCDATDWKDLCDLYCEHYGDTYRGLGRMCCEYINLGPSECEGLIIQDAKHIPFANRTNMVWYKESVHYFSQGQKNKQWASAVWFRGFSLTQDQSEIPAPVNVGVKLEISDEGYASSWSVDKTPGQVQGQCLLYPPDCPFIRTGTFEFCLKTGLLAMTEVITFDRQLDFDPSTHKIQLMTGFNQLSLTPTRASDRRIFEMCTSDVQPVGFNLHAYFFDASFVRAIVQYVAIVTPLTEEDRCVRAGKCNL